jgi:hypothetical protein
MRDVRLINSHCLGRPSPRVAGESAGTRPPASRREGGIAVSEMLARLRQTADADFYKQYEWRARMASLAEFLEREDCLPRWVPKVDRALRRLPLIEPPPEYPEEEYVPEYEDYGPYP